MRPDHGSAAAAVAAFADPPRAGSNESYAEHVNPQWLRLLNVLSMNVRYARCEGAELYREDSPGSGPILDFLSGYCVHNTGHNHPHLIQALQGELARRGPAMLQSHVPELAGELAQRLCAKAGGGLRKAYFCSSGSEGVEAAIKFARVHTGRVGLVSAGGAFHGLTCGALSLMDEPFWRGGFGPLLPETGTVPFGDLDALEQKLKGCKVAAFFVEPVQGEAGIRIPPQGYLAGAQALCRKYGTLLVADEVQTAFHRTGPFLASHHFGIEPDLVVLAKALSGGLVPSGAVLMRDEIYRSVYSSLKRSIVHTSTFSENGLSMRVGLAVLDVLESEGLEQKSAQRGEYLRARLREELSSFEMIGEVRGLGLLNGIEFKTPSSLGLKLSFESFRRIHPAMFGQVVVMRLFQEHSILTQICGNHFLVLKAAPPLVATERQVDRYVEALRSVTELMHGGTAFWTEALRMAARVAGI